MTLEEHRESNKENGEKAKEKRKEYYEKNKDRINEIKRLIYLANKIGEQKH